MEKIEHPPNSEGKKSYHRPILREFGELSEMTKVGTGNSGYHGEEPTNGIS